MSQSVTVKARVMSVQPATDGQRTIGFIANYTDQNGARVNQEWAKYTPAYSQTMTVLDGVMDEFAVGDEVDIVITKAIAHTDDRESRAKPQGLGNVIGLVGLMVKED